MDAGLMKSIAEVEVNCRDELSAPNCPTPNCPGTVKAAAN